MGIIKTILPSIAAIDVDEIQITDLFDVDLSHYFNINVDDTLNYTGLGSKIGAVRIYDPDAANDFVDFNVDPANGGIILVSTNITNDNLIEIDHNGTLSGATATSTMSGFNYDAAGITIDDGAANAIILRGAFYEMAGITATAVGLSTLEGIRIDLPIINATYSDGRGLGINENTNDCIVELVNSAGNAILVRGDTFNDGRNWNMTYPNTTNLIADVVNRLHYTTIEDITINDGANTPEIYGHHMIMIPSAETDVDGTILYGHYITMPDISQYPTGAGIHISENGSNSIVEIINRDNNAILIRGDTIETRDWIKIMPDIQTVDAGNTIKYIHVDTDNLTINDGATAPNIFGMHLNIDGITETDVNLTDLWGLYVEISPTLANYADGAAGFFTDATQSVRILDGTIPLAATTNLATDIAISTNGEIVSGNYPEEDYLAFELWESGSEVNVNISQAWDANEDEICLDIDATGATASVVIYCQYRIPSSFKEFPDTSDDITIRAIQDAGASINTTITIDFMDNSGTDADDDSVNTTALTNAWATYDCATVTADGTWVVGDAVTVQISLVLPDADDAIRIIVPKVLFKQSG